MMCANKENKYGLTPCPFSFKELGGVQDLNTSAHLTGIEL